MSRLQITNFPFQTFELIFFFESSGKNFPHFPFPKHSSSLHHQEPRKKLFQLNIDEIFSHSFYRWNFFIIIADKKKFPTNFQVQSWKESRKVSSEKSVAWTCGKQKKKSWKNYWFVPAVFRKRQAKKFPISLTRIIRAEEELM